ncbi:multicopper oxidase family protein [Methylocystis iwaonis]|uniref:Spore coat protein A n=1 Tax=Methylocystis iwaonis TaxID=2885079 RepID=A0ABM8E3X6_9HYPH|nr:multicopper oxidase domain-containing protein [Methylocystis iwaonis]BDV32543.1 spore coat protein A [Methylocystis iwaonis]
MVNRRDALKLGLSAAGAGIVAQDARAVPQSGLLFPDGYVPGFQAHPSPPATPFVAPLYVMPTAQPVSVGALGTPPDPARHQRYNEFLPKKFYKQVLSEIKWVYHPEGPYANGSWAYGFNGATPGETFYSRYGEPILVRRINNLPPVGTGNISFALPSSTIHRHNGHQASESDGNPADFTFPGEFWDHHYPEIYAGNDPREALSTLWYHDHRLDFTAPNVYAGLSGFHLVFDERDSGNERDPNPKAYRLPSGKYDVPLILHDVLFNQDGQPIWDFTGAHPITDSHELGGYVGNQVYTNHGMLGDRFTVNRRIQPYFQVERRKYRFRLLNGGPSRLYKLYLTKQGKDAIPFVAISNDGNLLPQPILTDNVDLWVANRCDIIVDFSKFNAGDKIYLTNRLGMRTDGAGLSGHLLDQGDLIMRFDVVGPMAFDPSRIPDEFRELPPINLKDVKRERLFVFDYDNGLWTVNGKLMVPSRIDAAIEQGTAEIWTIRNGGNNWSHPIHTHFEEFQIIERNGKPIAPGSMLNARKDVVELGPGDEVKFYGHWRDFLGKYVMHCHNVVHEDHSMMIRWDIVKPGQGF